jgi:flagellar hook-basal body complex protein FliE
MAIPPINLPQIGLTSGTDSATVSVPGQTPGGGEDLFGQALGAALGKLDAGQQQAAQAAQDLATGKATDIASVVNEVEKASLELQLATQVRNKVVDAYSELMRMQI